MNHSKLARLTSKFYKTSGVISVPDKIISEFERWAIGCYYRHAWKNLDNLETNLRATVKDFPKLVAYGKSISLFVGLVGKGDIEKILEIRGPQLYIPEFEHATGEYFLDEHRAAVEISRKDGLYSLFISLPKDEISLSGVGLSTVIGELKKHLKIIVKEAEDFIRFASNLRLPSEKNFKVLNIKKSIIKRKESAKDEKVFVIPISEIPYFNKLNLPVKDISIGAEFIVDFEVAEEIQAGNWAGLWMPVELTPEKIQKDPLFLGTVIIQERDLVDKPNRILDIEKEKIDLESIKDSVRHELQHMIQWALRDLKGLREIGGLPGKKMRTKEDPHGYYDGKKTLEYELLDIEFYTRLSDNIHRFNSIKTYFPVKLHEMLAKAYVGETNMDDVVNALMMEPEYAKYGDRKEEMRKWMIGNVDVKTNIFFEKLRESQPLKYEKAVKEFMKAVL